MPVQFAARVAAVKPRELVAPALRVDCTQGQALGLAHLIIAYQLVGDAIRDELRCRRSAKDAQHTDL